MVIACCCDDSSACLVVNARSKKAQHSDHSSKRHVQSSRQSVWLISETVSCMAWKCDGDKLLAIAM